MSQQLNMLAHFILGPKFIQNEPLSSFELDETFLFAELTAYPQRSALELLLTMTE